LVEFVADSAGETGDFAGHGDGIMEWWSDGMVRVACCV
jgi:hypothetical protein